MVDQVIVNRRFLINHMRMKNNNNCTQIISMLNIYQCLHVLIYLQYILDCILLINLL